MGDKTQRDLVTTVTATLHTDLPSPRQGRKVVNTGLQEDITQGPTSCMASLLQEPHNV